MTQTIALIAFGGNVVVGVLAVLVTYAGMERSILTGACTAVATGFTALFVERALGQQLTWSSWAALELTAIAAILGAVVGVALAILVWRPELQSLATTQPE
jgi:ABC-type nitrate/sulfonate/bicarbonate transport system permease component